LRRFVFRGCTLLAFAGTLAASSLTCRVDGVASSSCYESGGLTFTGNDNLNLYQAFGSASQAPLNVSSSPLTAHSTKGVQVSMSLGPGGQTMQGGLVEGITNTAYLTREDNAQWIYATDGYGDYAWDTPGDPGITPSFNSYSGQFNAPTAPVVGTEAGGAWGDYLIGPTSSAGGFAVGTLNINFSKNGQGVAGVAFDISTVSTSQNTNFVAEVDAYHGATLIGSYLINVTGMGGVCPGLVPNPVPHPCNDAPMLAIIDAPNQTITQVQVFGLDATGDRGFMIGNLSIMDAVAVPGVPEPATNFLSGAGLLLIAYAARRRFTPAGQSR
jgi:hypothetical protein